MVTKDLGLRLSQIDIDPRYIRVNIFEISIDFNISPAAILGQGGIIGKRSRNNALSKVYRND